MVKVSIFDFRGTLDRLKKNGVPEQSGSPPLKKKGRLKLEKKR